MGSLNKQARPRSPERVNIKQIATVEPSSNGYTIDVTLTVSYDAWDNPQEAYELKDAVVAVYKAIDGSRERAKTKRLKRLEEEYKGLEL
jgi:hypothetical protein